MHFSKQNDPDPKKLPAEFTFRQEKVWSELEKKIDPPDNRKVIAWLAAACVVVIAALGLWQLTGEEKIAVPSVATVTQKQKPKLTEQPEAPPIKKERVTKTVTAKQKIDDKSISPQTDTRNEPMAEVIKEPEVIQQPLELVITEPVKQTPARRFRIAHVNEIDLSVKLPITGIKAENSITYSEPTIAEINEIQVPIKPKGMFGLLRTNQ